MKQAIASNILRFSFGILLAGAISGCATSRQVEYLQGRGSKQSFNAPFDQTWQASVDAVYGNRLILLITNLTADGGFISAERGMNLTPSFGENVGIWVIPSSPTATQVEVVSRQKGPVARLKNWEPPLLHSIAANLGQLPVVKVRTPTRAAPPAVATATDANTSGSGSSPVAALTPTSRVEPEAPIDLNQRRDELRKYETLRAAELQYEKNARQRERLQAEVEYLREELRSVESRLSKQKQ